MHQHEYFFGKIYPIVLAKTTKVKFSLVTQIKIIMAFDIHLFTKTRFFRAQKHFGRCRKLIFHYGYDSRSHFFPI